MRGTDLLRAIGEIDDDLIEEASEYIPFTPHHTVGTRLKHWKICGAAAASVICLCVAGVTLYQVRYSKKVYEETGATAAGAFDVADSDTMDNTVVEDTAITDETLADKAVNNSALETDISDSHIEQESAQTFIEYSQESATTEGASTEDTAFNRDWSQYEIISEYDTEENAIYCYGAPEQGNMFCFHQLTEALNHYSKYDGFYAFNVCIDVFYNTKKNGENGDTVMQVLDGSTAIGQQLLREEYQRLIKEGYDVELSEDYKLSGCFTDNEITYFKTSPDYGYAFRFANEN